MQQQDWREWVQSIAELLERRTGADLETWNARVREVGFSDEESLRAWLTAHGVTGYPQMLLVMERFGYPDYLLASGEEVIEAQYRDRPELRPILDAVLQAAAALGPVKVQARKGYVSLLTPRKTFAAVQATTRSRVDLGLRLRHREPGGRLEPATRMGSGQVTVCVGLASVEEVDGEVRDLLEQAYRENA